MWIWRWMVLAAGVLGVAGFFAPFLEYSTPDGQIVGASAYEIVMGRFDVSALMAGAARLGVVSSEEAARATEVVHRIVQSFRYVILGAHLPVVMLMLIGLTALVRQRLGRMGGLFATLSGVVSVGVWVFFFRAPDPHDQAIARVGLGLYCLGAAGLLGIGGGLGALIVPERRAA